MCPTIRVHGVGRNIHVRSRRLSSLRTKVGIAVIGTLLLGGSGTVLAMTATHGNLGFSQASPTAHSGDHEGDQDDVACTGTPTERAASPTAHAGDDSHDSASATRTPGQDDREGSATRTPDQDDRAGNTHENDNECENGEGTRTPEPTERPEGTRTPDATGTPGGD
jgi:hypothetical protein